MIFPAKIPNIASVPGNNGACQTCHDAEPGHEAHANLNAFGLQFFNANSSEANRANWSWSPALAAQDADLDGFTNGWELQDPNGTFTGGASPGIAALVTHPARDTSQPPKIGLSLSSLDPNTPQGFSPDPQMFTLSNAGLLPLAATITTDFTTDFPWLSVDDSSVGTRTITYSTSGLAAAQYVGHVQVAQVGVSNSPQTITVTLEVLPRCGNGTLEGSEQCDDGNLSNGDCCTSSCQFQSSGFVCRAANGVCDVADTCTGSSGACPANQLVPDGTSCDLGNVCAVNGQCSGGACLGDPGACGDGLTQAACGEQCDDGNTLNGDCCSSGCRFESSETVCRAAASDCDADDHCTGSSGSCPADAKAPDGTTCNDGNQCTITDRCAGGHCAGNPHTCGDGITQSACGELCDGETCCTSECTFQDASVLCRPEDTSHCDVADLCTGTSAQCSADAFKPEGTFCSETEVCSAVGTCAGPTPSPQSSEQAACIDMWEKSATAAVRVRANQVASCIEAGAKRKLATSIDACIASSKPKVVAAIARADKKARNKCALDDAPSFGTDADADLGQITADEMLATFQGIFGQDLDAAVPASTTPLVKCQIRVARQMAICMEKRFDSFASCAHSGLAAKIDPFDDFTDLLFCLRPNPLIEFYCAPEANTVLAAKMSNKCSDEPASLATAFAGCVAADPNSPLERLDLYRCMDRVSACHTCRAVNAWAHLARNCDLADDGDPNNASCPN